jgi:hypothetical protein
MSAAVFPINNGELQSPLELNGHGFTEAGVPVNISLVSNANLIAIAALTTISFGRGLLEKTSGNVISYIGAATAAQGAKADSAIQSVSVASANGVSGSSSGGTTPAITIALGAITPASVNGLTFVGAATGFTIAGGTTSKTLTVSNTLALAGTDGSTLNVGAGGTLGTAAFTAASAYAGLTANTFSGDQIAHSFQSTGATNSIGFNDRSNAVIWNWYSDSGTAHLWSSTGFDRLNVTAAGAASFAGALTASNLSGTNTGDQVVPSNTTATSNQFFTAYNSGTGAFTKAQPAFTDLSGTAVAGQIPTLDAAKIGTGTVATARLGSGTANSGSFLRGDQTWTAVTVPTIASTSSVLKGDGSGNAVAATAGTDYLTPSGNGSALTGLTQSQISGLTTASTPTFAGITIGASSANAIYLHNDNASFAILRRDQSTNDTGLNIVLLGGASGATSRGSIGFTHTGSGADTLFTGEMADMVGIAGASGIQLGKGSTITMTVMAGLNVGGTSDPGAGIISSTALNLVGTAGAGFIDLAAQSSPPSNPASNHIRIFNTSANKFGWVGASGYVRTFDGTLTASRTYTLPDLTGGVLLDTSTISGSQVSGGTFGAVNASNLTNLPAIPESGVTNLVSDLALKAPLASPTFSGNVSLTGTGRILIGGAATSTGGEYLYSPTAGTVYFSNRGDFRFYADTNNNDGTFQEYSWSTGVADGSTAGYKMVLWNSGGLSLQNNGTHSDPGAGNLGLANLTASVSVASPYFKATVTTSSGGFQLNNRGQIWGGASDGILVLSDFATAATFNRLDFGGTTSSFPAIKRSSASLQLRLADDSGWTDLSLGTRNATNNTVTDGLTLGHQLSSGTAAAGLGERILGNLDDTTTPDVNAFALEYSWTDPAHATRTSKAVIKTVNSGTLAAVLSLFGNGDGTLAGVLTSTGIQVNTTSSSPFNLARTQTATDTGMGIGFYGGASGTAPRGTFGFTKSGGAGSTNDSFFASETVNAMALRSETVILLGIGYSTPALTIDSNRTTMTTPFKLASYTVATLPAGSQGDVAYVTDATAPTYLGALTGGGTVKCPVFYNGISWISH